MSQPSEPIFRATSRATSRATPRVLVDLTEPVDKDRVQTRYKLARSLVRRGLVDELAVGLEDCARLYEDGAFAGPEADRMELFRRVERRASLALLAAMPGPSAGVYADLKVTGETARDLRGVRDLLELAEAARERGWPCRARVRVAEGARLDEAEMKAVADSLDELGPRARLITDRGSAPNYLDAGRVAGAEAILRVALSSNVAGVRLDDRHLSSVECPFSLVRVLDKARERGLSPSQASEAYRLLIEKLGVANGAANGAASAPGKSSMAPRPTSSGATIGSDELHPRVTGVARTSDRVTESDPASYSMSGGRRGESGEASGWTAVAPGDRLAYFRQRWRKMFDL